MESLDSSSPAIPRLFVFCASALATLTFCGCSVLPAAVEGGEIKVDRGRNADPEDLLKHASVINLVEQLDPLHLCQATGYVGPRNSDSSAAQEVLKLAEPTAAAALKCAFEAFYSSQSFERLPDREKDELRVNGVLTTYAERQLEKLKQISDSIDAGVQEGRQREKDGAIDQSTYAAIANVIREKILQPQLDQLYDSIPVASAQAPLIEHQRRRRNRVQSSILTASDAACDAYKRSLNHLYSTNNYGFGAGATIAGGLGAAISDLGTARGLAALGGIISGVRAEYNDSFFRNKVVELLTKAMDNARNRKKDEIRRRQIQLISDYSVEEAVNDGIVYNSQCTLIAGLQEASESLQTVSDPGLRWLATAFGGAAADSNLTQSLFTSLGSAVGTVQKIQKKVEDPNAPATAVPRAPVPVQAMPAAGAAKLRFVGMLRLRAVGCRSGAQSGFGSHWTPPTPCPPSPATSACPKPA